MIPDPRFVLANERTLLAWVRTALALVIGGAGVGTLTHGFVPDWLRLGLALLLLVLGAVVTIGGLRRHQAADAAMREGVDIPATALPMILTGGVLVAVLVGAVAVVTSRG